MQQEDADPLAKVDAEDDSAATKQTLEALTKLSDEKELERFLSYGKWGLSDEDIERLQKDEEMKQRVSSHFRELWPELNLKKQRDKTILIHNNYYCCTCKLKRPA